ncbi:MAG TPA: FAD-binding oxidoreductase [Gammaproteobacteria bacterium]
MIRYDQEIYQTELNESVLDCLLRHGIVPPHSCRSGLCQTCMMRAVKGKPTEVSQQGLKEALVSQNFFLPCACVPQEDMEIVLPDTRLFRKETYVIGKTLLSANVLRLRLAIPDNYQYLAGQYTTLFKNQSLGRCYSLASVPGVDDFLEFHIKLLPGGQISQWLHHEVATGSSITISEAVGNCIYLDRYQQRPMALIGTGTGLAPLTGIMRDALHKGHQGEIRIYHGVKTRHDLYLHETLVQLAQTHGNVRYFPCVSREPVTSPFYEGRASELAMNDIGKFAGWCVYLCGNPDMVNTTKRNAFLAGASFQDICADPFIHSQ